MTNIKSCKNSWNFQPRQKASPLLPAWALNGYLLTGFELGPEHPVHNIQMNEGDASALLKALYSQLSWPELMRLLDRPETEKHFNSQQLMESFGFGWDEHWQRVSELLLVWPLSIQNYVSEKALRPFDLMVLMSLPLENQNHLLSQLVEMDLSKSVFCQTLELAGENLLLGMCWDDLKDKLKHPNFLAELKKQRFPVSHSSDQGFKEKIEKASWPKGVQAQTQRRGDTLGVEFKIFAKNKEELSKILQNLEKTYEQLDSTL